MVSAAPTDDGPGVLAHPPFRRLWLASTVSGFGSYVTTVALQVLIVITLDGSATDVGWVSSARWLPYLVLGVVAGVVIERVRRRPVIVMADLGRGVLLLAIPLLALADALSIATLALIVGVIGLLSLGGEVAGQALLPRVVPRRQIVVANARLDQSDAVAQTSGPAVGGALVAVLTAPWAIVVDAVSFLFSGLMIARVEVDEPPRSRTRGRFVADLREGLVWVYRHRTLAPQAIATHLWFVFFSVFTTVFAPFALRTQHLGEVGLGIVLAMAGVGGVIGSSVATRLGTRFGAGRVVIASNLGAAVAFTLVALAAAGDGNGSGTTVAAALLVGAGQFVLGLSMGTSNANEMGFRQTITPDALQARTNATMRSINRAMVVFAAPLGGLLGDTYGYRTAMWISAAGMVVVAAFLAASPFRDVRLDV